MAKIKTFDLDRWSEPDEQHRVRHIGMANAEETFRKLELHLKSLDLLPDEYFLYDGDRSAELKDELPDFEYALCVPNFGVSEGIYLDINLVCRDHDGKQKYIDFATGKTLDESGDAFLHMHRIAAECSLMLNGRGFAYERNEVPLFLTAEEADAVTNAIELELLADNTPEKERLLSAVMDKINGQQLTPVHTLTRHGEDDYSLWTAEIPVAVWQQIARTGKKAHGAPEDMMEQMEPDSMRVLFSHHEESEISLSTIPAQLEQLSAFSHWGKSIRGSKVQILEDLTEKMGIAQSDSPEMQLGGM